MSFLNKMSVSSAITIFGWRQFSVLFCYHLRVKLNRKESIESGVGVELEKKKIKEFLGKICNYEVCHFISLVHSWKMKILQN